MSTRCRCPCDDLRCADRRALPRPSDAEQVLSVAELGVVAAALDRNGASAKTDRLGTVIRLLPGMSRLTDSEVNVLLARAAARSQSGQRWLCDTTARIRSPALRRLAFRLVAMFCAAPGELAADAQEYLAAVATAFNFSEDEARQLFAEATGWQLEPEAA